MITALKILNKLNLNLAANIAENPRHDTINRSLYNEKPDHKWRPAFFSPLSLD